VTGTHIHGISGTIAELMLQHIENQHIKHLIETGNITYYARYVDDIFIVYDSTKTTIEEIQSYADHIHKNLKFTITQENNKQINFLDILITRQEKRQTYTEKPLPQTLQLTTCRITLWNTKWQHIDTTLTG
jgi:organic radical activating enzyme